MAKAKKKKISKKKEFELPMWLALFMTFIFILTWFLMSQATFYVGGDYAFWIIMTMAFLLPVLILWLIYFEVIEI